MATFAHIRKAIAIGALVLCLLFVVGLGFFLKNPTFSSVNFVGIEGPSFTERLIKHVSFLVNLNTPRNFKNIESLNKAAEYIHKEFSSLGLKPEYQTYEIGGPDYKNVRASIRGETDRLIVIGAHYDVAGEAPGADDNASGVAGLLELARLLKESNQKLSHTIELVAYTLEEPPYLGGREMGSYYHALDLSEAGKRVDLMISLEMIGYFSNESWSQDYPSPLLRLYYPNKGNFIAVVGDVSSRTLLRKLKNSFRNGTLLPIESLNAPSFIQGVDFSDHRNYWLFDYPAVMITDTAFYRNKNYHEKTDTIDTLNFQKMQQVVVGVASMVVNFK